MAITRLQQARQMFRYGGDTMGGPNDKGANTGGNNNAVDTGDLGTEKANVASTKSAETNLGMSNRDRAISNMYTNIKAPTKTITSVNPHTDKITTMKVPTTYKEKFESYGNPGFGKDKGLGFNFAPTDSTKFNLKSALFNAALFAINPALAAKYSKAKSLYNAAKFAGELAQTFGITNTNVAEDFIGNLTSNLTSKGKTTSKTDDDPTTRDGDGIGSTPEMAALRDEYYLLLQKLQTGSILNSERNRLTALKNLLGMA